MIINHDEDITQGRLSELLVAAAHADPTREAQWIALVNSPDDNHACGMHIVWSHGMDTDVVIAALADAIGHLSTPAWCPENSTNQCNDEGEPGS